MREMSFFKIILLNILLCCLWSFIAFILCIKMGEKSLDYRKKRYIPQIWENNGKWYEKNLNIKVWKDLVPQHIGKGGFSKRHMKKTSPEYIDRFILETCRGEWNHECCCIYSIIAIIINPIMIGVVIALLNLLINLPCVAIQRYNRIRLINLKTKMSKKHWKMWNR